MNRYFYHWILIFNEIVYLSCWAYVVFCLFFVSGKSMIRVYNNYRKENNNHKLK